MQKISRRHDAIKLVTEISPTLINSKLVLDIWISDTVPNSETFRQ